MKHGAMGPVIVVNEIYPGVNLGELTGDMTTTHHVVFFHPKHIVEA